MTEHYDGHDRDHNHQQRSEDEHTKQIAHDAAQEAVTEVLQRLGIDDHDWREQQKDHAYLRRFRLGSEQASLWIVRSGIVTVVGGILWAVWAAVKAGR